jgi:rRNA-processing protein FCF1
MASAPRSPLDGTDRLVVDGTNLLHRLGRGGAAPPAAAIGRLRAVIPAAVSIDLVFDGVGHDVAGRVAHGIYVRYAGRRTADDAIVELAASGASRAGGGPASSARVLVVTDDRELRARLTATGVRSVPLAWLTNRLETPRLSAPAMGNRRPPVGAHRLADEEPQRQPWKPGRHATSKVGPARRVARHRRHPSHRRQGS